MKMRVKKNFDFPTQANTSGGISVRAGLQSNQPFNTEFAGDSVDEHKAIESANEEMAQKIISQTSNNS